TVRNNASLNIGGRRVKRTEVRIIAQPANRPVAPTNRPIAQSPNRPSPIAQPARLLIAQDRPDLVLLAPPADVFSAVSAAPQGLGLTACLTGHASHPSCRPPGVRHRISSTHRDHTPPE